VIGPPTASISSPADNQKYNLGQQASASFTCTEATGGPGIKSCLDGAGHTSPAGLDTSTVGTHAYTVTATSLDGQTDTATIHYTVIGPPTARIDSPADGRTFTLSQPVSTKFTCTEAENGPGIKSCLDGTGHISPASLDTSAVGTFTYTVTATSLDGQTATATIRYSVMPAFLGFVAPLPKSKLISSNAVIPVKFQIGTYTGALLSDAAAAAVATKMTISANADGSNPLSTVTCPYDTKAHLFQCDLKTPRGVATGTSHPYYLTAYQQIGGAAVVIPPSATPRTPNPEIVYFK
jgi:hypothetical protein